MIETETYLREEFENAKQAMSDWEVLAMEERSIRRDLTDRVSDLEDQLASLQKDYARASEDRDTNSSTVDGLKKALSEIQNARKRELREVVEKSELELSEMRKQWEAVKEELQTCQVRVEESQAELERALPFEKEVKEKNLLIGKLRHEAVILNEHLTKALKFLKAKRGGEGESVDRYVCSREVVETGMLTWRRQIMTNHLLHFLALDRSDPKKFQILQLIAALLNWNDEQREQAGLLRAGGSSLGGSLTGSLRLPGTPMMHKTPSSPALSRLESDYLIDGGSPSVGRESLAELWQSFLEQESRGERGSKSRTPSQGAGMGITSPGLPPAAGKS